MTLLQMRISRRLFCGLEVSRVVDDGADDIGRI